MKYVLVVIVLIVIGKRARFISKAIKKNEIKRIFFEAIFLILLICLAYLLYWFSSDYLD